MRTAPLQRSAGKARATAAIKLRKCKVCKKSFAFPYLLKPIVCSPACGEAWAKAKREKAEAKRAAIERKADRAKRESLKTRSQWMTEAQAAFNGFIRARDALLPCICCGKFSQGAGKDRGGEWDAGHYRSRGAAPELRFDERNVHAQLKQCNRRAFDVAGYRANLIQRIGRAEVERLEGPHPPRKYTVVVLKEIRDTYRKREREMVRALETEAA